MGLGRCGPLHNGPFWASGDPLSPPGLGLPARDGAGQVLALLPEATPSSRKNRTHVTGSPKTKVQRNPQGRRPCAGFSQKGQERGSVQSYRWGTHGDSYEVSLRGLVPFPLGSRDASPIRDCPLSTAPQGKSQPWRSGPQRGERV